MADTRTTREFPLKEVPWSIVETWAAEFEYRLFETTTGGRIYRSSGFWKPTVMLDLRAEGTHSLVEAWIAVNRPLLWVWRVFCPLFFLLPFEIRIESGGATLAIPRDRARMDINVLLTRLGLESIP